MDDFLVVIDVSRGRVGVVRRDGTPVRDGAGLLAELLADAADLATERAWDAAGEVGRLLARPESGVV